MFNHELVIDNFKENLKKYNYKTDKRILESLKIVGLDDSILNKKYYELKYIELKKVSLALILVYNPRVIILENYSEGLNNKDKNELIRLFRILKNKYKRIIILISKDTDFCYSISDYFYLLDKNGIVKQGNKTLINNTELLNKLNLKTPDIVKFINEYRKYNKEFSDYTNILDLIKAVYRDIGYKR
jgi:energy-coupling factor transporter ATP-binding protein EcfA2